MQIANLLQHLSAQDSEHLAFTLSQAFPADGATCYLRSGWSFNDETLEMSFAINSLITKTNKASSTDINILFGKIIAASTPKAVEILENDIEMFIKCSATPYILETTSHFLLDGMGMIFTAAIKAKAIIKTMDELELTMKNLGYGKRTL